MRDATPQLLVVEDDLSVCRSVLSMLTALCFAVRLAPNGFTVLAKIRRNVPGMAGVALPSAARREALSSRVIAKSSVLPSWGVPPEVVADAICREKAHPGLLLQIMEEIARPRQSMMTHRTHSLAPVWIPVHHTSGGPYVPVICPECFRTSSHIPDRHTGARGKADCVYCRSPIRCLIVHSLNPALSRN
jgi:hypothetical protein